MKFKHSLAASVISLVICVAAVAQTIPFQARVIDVVDGSTVIVETQTRTTFVVKCQATTAPQKTEPYADNSKERLSNIVLKKMVTVESTQRNEYGQLLGTIFLEGEDVCLSQIADGLARFEPQAPNNLKTSRRELYASSEMHARNRGAGVWTTYSTAAGNVNVLNNTVPGQGLSSVGGTQSPDSSVVAPNSSNSGTNVDLREYFRKDGTYVAPHKRTAAEARLEDEWNTVGNVKSGGRNWFARNWWIFPTVGALIGTGYLVRRSLNSNSSSVGLGILCNDGTVSQAQHRQGACSHHGGIR